MVAMTPPFNRSTLGIICAMLCFGCDSKQTRPAQSTPAIKRTPIFDLVASTPDYSNAIVAADRDLPGDMWSTGPIRENESRGRRLAPIAKRILEEVRPKLKQMSVVELVNCLKVFDGSGFVTGYIADEIYPQGNEMILAEMRSRPAQERQTLLGLVVDAGHLDTGSQGPPTSMDEIIRELAPPNNSGGVHP